MKINAIPVITAALLVACATTPDKAAYLPAQGSACIEQSTAVNGTPAAIRWCIASQMFQPRKYAVTLDGKSIFSGTDYTRVNFSNQTRDGLIKGHCEEHITLVDNQTSLPVMLAVIPNSTVEACKIESTQDGRSARFVKTEACDVHFYPDLAPLLGPIIPVENLRRCTIDLNNTRIFDGIFTTARRF
jgi:hypothetical protein